MQVLRIWGVGSVSVLFRGVMREIWRLWRREVHKIYETPSEKFCPKTSQLLFKRFTTGLSKTMEDLEFWKNQCHVPEDKKHILLLTGDFTRYRIPVFDFEKWGCEHRMILLIPHKKKTQVSSWWLQSSRTCLYPTRWSSQPTSIFSLLETTHTQPRIDS